MTGSVARRVDAPEALPMRLPATAAGLGSPSDPKFSVVMLLNNAAAGERAVARARVWAQLALTRVLTKQTSKATLQVVDWGLHSPRVTDIWIWRTRDVRAYHQLLADLRANEFWIRHCKVVETLVGVEETDAANYYRGMWPEFKASRAPEVN